MSKNLCDPEGFKNEIRELEEKGDIDALYHWFDGGVTKKGAFEKGDDVFRRVIFPYIDKYMSDNTEQDFSALDLGYGMGTKIQSAIRFLPIVYGLDVHDDHATAIGNLDIPKGHCVYLLSGEGTDIPESIEPVDFVYSWVTFCHLGTIENVKQYLSEIFRVLKPGGVAVLFFTRLIRSGKNQKWVDVEADMVKEREHPTGYREGGPLSKVRTINLVISMWKMEEMVKDAGFELLERTASWDDTDDGRVYHGQYGVVIQKPKPKTTSTTAPPPQKKTKPIKKTKIKKKPALKRGK